MTTESAIQIEEVSDRRARREFVDCARKIYPADSPWVRALDAAVFDYLDQRKNPFFKQGCGQAYLARRGRSVVGGVLVHVWARHRRLHQEPVAYFGFFECVDDPAVARALFDAARRFARAQGCAVLRGPINMTMAQEMGLLLDGFSHPPSIDMIYTAPWYPALMAASGLRPVFSASTWKNSELESGTGQPEEKTPSPGSAAHGVSYRTMKFFGRNEEMEHVRQVVNAAFLGNYGFVPITREEWVLQLGPLLPLMDPAIVQIAEVQGTMVGVSLVVPDFNLALKHVNGRLLHPAMLRLVRARSLRAATVILFAVRKQYQGLGVSRELNVRLLQSLRVHGYRSLSITWIADENAASLAQARALGMQLWHRVGLFETNVE